MKRRRLWSSCGLGIAGGAVLGATFFCVWLGGSIAASAQPDTATGAPIVPVPLALGLDPAKVALGEMLFHDARLSRANSVACASCHRLSDGGDDDVARALGADGGLLPFNAPTVFNAALSFRLNWRGNFRTLEEQAEAVLFDPRLMNNSSWDEVLARLRSDATYRQAFVAIYGEDPKPPHVLDALASYQRSLLTPDAPFDRFLRGEREAITPDAERGYQLFKLYGCISCHQGVNVGGNLFQKFGIFQNPTAGGGERSEEDSGRFTITGRDKDRDVFRVPSLRNVSVTAPYFHDGRAETLDQAVAEMARSQLGRVLTNEEVGLIEDFLRSLTGEYRGVPLRDEASPARQQ
jgi:cytochrome c peroxidase